MDIDFPDFFYEEDEEASTSAPKNESISVPTGAEHFESIVDNKIALIEAHPLTMTIARTMKQHKPIILQIMYSAAKIALDDIDSTWIGDQLERRFTQEERGNNFSCCEDYISQLARYAAFDAEARYSSIIRKMQLIRLRADELDSECANERKGENKIRRKRSYSQQNDKESNDEDDDRYMLRLKFNNSVFKAKPLSDEPTETSDKPLQPILINEFNGIKENEELKSKQPAASTDHVVEPTRRQLLRDQFSSNIGFVKPLGRDAGPDQPLNTNLHIDGARYVEIVQRERNDTKKRDSYQNKKPFCKTNQSQRIQKKVTKKCLQAEVQEFNEQIEDVRSSTKNESFFAQSELTIKSKNSASIKILAQYRAKASKKQSCLSKKERTKRNIRIRFSEDVDFEKRSSDAYATRLTKNGQFSTNLILPYDQTLDNTQVGEDKNSTILPNCDRPIKLAVRKNPYVENRTSQAEIQRGITTDFNSIMRLSLYSKRIDENSIKAISRLLITDSMLSSLNIKLFRNMDMIALNYPRMPSWFIESLNQWFANEKLKSDQGGVFLYTKVFISLGLDINFYYADPKGKEIDIIINFLGDILEWFKAKIDVISMRARKERGLSYQHEHTSVELRWNKLIRLDDGTQEQMDVWLYRILQLPSFVVITIPEIGGWKRYFVELNKRLRLFVNEPYNSKYFQLLDWAEITHNAETENHMLVDTVAKRTLMLVQEMHRQHGVIYK